MAVDLLNALEIYGRAKKYSRPKDFTFQHSLCHDFESLLWVITYAMMVRRRNTLAATDSRVTVDYKEVLDGYWGAHSYFKLMNCHDGMISAGTRRTRGMVEEVLFSDPLEVEFFRSAMRLVRDQGDGEEPITYEKMQALFQTHVQKAAQATVSTLAPA